MDGSGDDVSTKKMEEMDEVSVSSGRLTITNDMSHFRVKQKDRGILSAMYLLE